MRSVAHGVTNPHRKLESTVWRLMTLRGAGAGKMEKDVPETWSLLDDRRNLDHQQAHRSEKLIDIFLHQASGAKTGI